MNTIEHVQLEVDFPKNKTITPVMDIFVMNKSRTSKKPMLMGVGSFRMFQYMNKITRKAEGVLGMLDGDSDDDDDDDFEQKSKSSHSEGGQQLPDFDNLPDEKLPIPYELPTKLKIVRNEDYEAE